MGPFPFGFLSGAFLALPKHRAHFLAKAPLAVPDYVCINAVTVDIVISCYATWA